MKKDRVKLDKPEAFAEAIKIRESQIGNPMNPETHYCWFCSYFPEDCDPAVHHNDRSGFVYCKTCDGIWHSKYPPCLCEQVYREKDSKGRIILEKKKGD